MKWIVLRCVQQACIWMYHHRDFSLLGPECQAALFCALFDVDQTVVQKVGQTALYAVFSAVTAPAFPALSA